MKTEKEITIHRHGNRIALHSESMSATIYLGPEMAFSLANAMIDCCQDVEKNSFVESQFIGRNIGES